MFSSIGPSRILVLGAHPDDAEFHAGGLLARHRRKGSVVCMVSVTDGRSGHHEIPPPDLVPIRREEARQAGQVIGASYETWDFPDGSLEPNLAVREAIITKLRTFRPHLVLTHRPNDYHPDHRAVGQAVQDASYMVTVPHVVPHVPALKQDPIVAYMVDTFTRPNPLRSDVVLDVTEEVQSIVQMMACHVSQFFQWLPYHDQILAEVPATEQERFEWLKKWYLRIAQQRIEHFQYQPQLRDMDRSHLRAIEVYEISEYAARLSDAARNELFPGELSHSG